MKIGILGTGMVGKTLGTKMVELGHDVMLGSRSAENPAALEWAKASRGRAGTFAEAAAHGELVFVATKGEHTATASTLANADETLAGKVVVDVTNPLDFSKGMPPTLTISNDDSLGELLQRNHPGVRIVKALNTMWCGLMVAPRMLPESHHTFVSGNDADAKAQVVALLKSMGWRDEEVVDLGDITTARGTEMYLPLWVRLYGVKGTGAFNLKLVFAG
ncbi:MAG: NAD(P)-binding domain-containing protein [Sandaracinus sp.]|nr:NAD(P)-binding domain-containing protein [Sandaracinus sp.]